MWINCEQGMGHNGKNTVVEEELRKFAAPLVEIVQNAFSNIIKVEKNGQHQGKKRARKYKLILLHL